MSVILPIEDLRNRGSMLFDVLWVRQQKIKIDMCSAQCGLIFIWMDERGRLPLQGNFSVIESWLTMEEEFLYSRILLSLQSALPTFTNLPRSCRGKRDVEPGIRGVDVHLMKRGDSDETVKEKWWLQLGRERAREKKKKRENNLWTEYITAE